MLNHLLRLGPYANFHVVPLDEYSMKHIHVGRGDSRARHGSPPSHCWRCGDLQNVIHRKNDVISWCDCSVGCSLTPSSQDLLVKALRNSCRTLLSFLFKCVYHSIALRTAMANLIIACTCQHFATHLPPGIGHRFASHHTPHLLPAPLAALSTAHGSSSVWLSMKLILFFKGLDLSNV